MANPKWESTSKYPPRTAPAPAVKQEAKGTGPFKTTPYMHPESESMATMYLGSDEDESTGPVISRAVPSTGQTPQWVREVQRQRRAYGRTETGPTVGATPNLQTPLSKKKQEAMPLAMPQQDKVSLMKKLTQEAAAKPILKKEHADSPAFRRPMKIDRKTGKAVFVKPKESAEREFKSMENEAWKYLRSAPGTPETTSGTIFTDKEGRTLSLTVETFVRGIENAEWRPNPGPLKSTVTPTPRDNRRRTSKPVSSILPGYDPKGKKGLFAGLPHDIEPTVTESLKRMPVEESIRSGMVLEQALGKETAESRAAGHHILESMGRTQAAAQAHRARSSQLADEFTQRAVAHRAFIDQQKAAVLGQAKVAPKRSRKKK